MLNFADISRKQIPLSDVIAHARPLDCDSDDARDAFPCLYARDGDGDLYLQMPCFLDAYPKVVDDRDVYPDFVRDNGLQLVYYGQQFIDVMSSVREQRPGASAENFLDALNHYRNNDDFLDFQACP